MFARSFFLINSTERGENKILFHNASMCCECMLGSVLGTLCTSFLSNLTTLLLSTQAETRITEDKQLIYSRSHS